MVHPQSSRIRKGEKAVNEHGKRNSALVNSRGYCNVVLVLVRKDMSQAGERKQESEKGARADKTEEEAVVPSSYAVVDPDTVVIQSLYTIVAYPAVITPRRAPDIACLAVFDRDVHCGGLGCRQSDHDPVVGGWPNSKRVFVVSRRERMYITREDLT